MFLVDTVAGRIIEDDEIKAELAGLRTVGRVARATADPPRRPAGARAHRAPARLRARRQRTFGYTEEEVRILLTPMARTGAEPLGAMGSDTPVAVLQRAPAAAVRLLHPAVRPGDEPAAGLDPRRGRHLAWPQLGPERNLLAAGQVTPSRSSLRLPGASTTTNWPRSSTSTRRAARRLRCTVRGLYRFEGGGKRRCAPGSQEICAEVDAAIEAGAEFIVLSRPGLEHGPRADPVAAADRPPCTTTCIRRAATA